MTDKVIRVNVTSSKSQKVTVSSSKVANEITASPDTSAYYSKLAKNWAIAEGLVENIDYSSKHYAQESKASADMAKTYENATQENYNMFMEASVNANSELLANREEALADIEESRAGAVDSLNSVKDENIASIEAKGDSLTSEITSLSNGYISQINTTGKSYDNLTHRNITNCLLEVPQRIKLELKDGTLTLKAGSVVIVPNGAGVFEEVVITSDKTTSQTSNGIYFVGIGNAVKNLTTRRLENVASGSTDSIAGTTYHWWYDTTNNVIKNYGSDVTTPNDKVSLPIAIVTVSNNVITSIDQVFNGMGYIGSTVWVDKGVKGLIPDGRNGDGTLNNVEFSTSNLIVRTFVASNTGYRDLFVNQSAITILANYSYNAVSNFNINTDLNTVHNGCLFGSVLLNKGVISNFQPKLPFRAIDYSDKSKISGWGMPSKTFINLTLGASGTTYTAPANGWVFIDKRGASGQYINFNGAINLIASSWGSNAECTLLVPIQKGHSFKINYNLSGDTIAFKFFYAQGEV